MTENNREGMPTREELRIWRGYIETTEALRAHLARQMQSESGLSLGDYAVLLALKEAPDNRLRPSDLADKISWERSRLSHHLRRMEARQLIRRVECAEDNRGAEVVLTDTGKVAFRQSSFPHLREIQKVFVEAIAPDQLEQLGKIIDQLRESLDEAATHKHPGN